MAVYTQLSHEEATRIAAAHGLGAVHAVHGVLAGSVNSNFFLDTDARRVFARIYEEQDERGVEYERALLEHLARARLPVPRPITGPALHLGDKPIALFEVLGGTELCQRAVDPSHASAVGALLARAHEAVRDFPER